MPTAKRDVGTTLRRWLTAVLYWAPFALDFEGSFHPRQLQEPKASRGTLNGLPP